MLIAFVLALLAQVQSARTPQIVVDELLAADRAFAAKAATLNVLDALGAMFNDDVRLVVPGGFARGKSTALEALGANPDNAKSRVEWTPARGGISADGQHGFTLGYMTLHKPDGTRVPIKYLAYWIKRDDGWRVAVYKRQPGAALRTPPAMLPAALPERLVGPASDSAAIARHRQTLDAAERAFSDEAQVIGIGAAFAKHGSVDAMNMGPPTEPLFVVGSEAIGRSVGAGAPSTGSALSWAPDEVIVASSGDLGVTIGTIRRNTPASGQPNTIPFITVWRRASVSDLWKYVAE